MRRTAWRALVLLLTLTLLAPLFCAGAPAEAPSFNNIYDACDYLRACMDARETEIALFLDEDACARWETDEVREALEDTMAMAGLIGVRVDRHEDRSADVRISIEYCDAVRMVDAYRSGDLSGLSTEEQQCLAMAVEAATQLRATYSDALSLEKAIYDLICRNVTYRNYPDTTSAEFSRVVTVPSAMLEGVGNCQAYARMFYLLGTLCGLKVGFLSGWYADHDEGQHIWNTIELNGRLYMVDVTDGDFDNADESAPQVQYRSFNIGWDRVPADSWNWWPPACDERICNDTDPDLCTTMAGPASAAASPAWTPPPKLRSRRPRPAMPNGSASSWANTPIPTPSTPSCKAPRSVRGSTPLGRSGIGRRTKIRSSLCTFSPSRAANGQ